MSKCKLQCPYCEWELAPLTTNDDMYCCDNPDCPHLKEQFSTYVFMKEVVE
jgi:hypothetical protein